ncbi:hypothetical protein [Nonomuraea sp. NPDC050643]|uniref:hypothetical protein n=1 Tax=Nonomuraea sp. NPDC050643 TaxID=3155660 RepID=UPI003404694F
MKRIAAAAALVVAAVALFVVGRGVAAEPLTLTTTGTRYAATVELAEPTTGRVTVKVAVTSGDADSVVLSAVMADMGHATPEVTARAVGRGRFQAEGELFAMSGVWELSIRLNGPAGEEELAVKALITD